MTDIIADDGFAGAGGWDLGAAMLGIYARGIENMLAARATRDAAGLATIHDDVWTHIPDGLATLRIDSPPCQTFSAAGHGSGRKALNDVLLAIQIKAYNDIDALRQVAEQFGDARTGLVLAPLHFATTYDNYRMLAWEQVPAVLPVWEACAEVLRDQGWNVWTGLLYAEQYGVPQTRKRAVLIASRDHEVHRPVPTHSRFHARTPAKLDADVSKWVSMYEALGMGLTERPSPTVTGGGTETGGAEPLGHLARWTSRPDWLESNYSGGTVDENGRRPLATFDVSLPAPTITSKPHKWVHVPEAVVAAGITGAGVPRMVENPAPTMTGKGTAYWLNNAEDYAGPTKMGDVRSSHGCVRDIDEPAPTMTGSMDNGNFQFVNDEVAPSVKRRVTVAEAGILQTFPADYPWQGKKGDQYLQAGNAVPPLLARAILAVATGREA